MAHQNRKSSLLVFWLGFFFKQKRADQDIVMRLFQGALPSGGMEAGAGELVVFK